MWAFVPSLSSVSCVSGQIFFIVVVLGLSVMLLMLYHCRCCQATACLVVGRRCGECGGHQRRSPCILRRKGWSSPCTRSPVSPLATASESYAKRTTADARHPHVGCCPYQHLPPGLPLGAGAPLITFSCIELSTEFAGWRICFCDSGLHHWSYQRQ